MSGALDQEIVCRNFYCAAVLGKRIGAACDRPVEKTSLSKLDEILF